MGVVPHAGTRTDHRAGVDLRARMDLDIVETERRPTRPVFDRVLRGGQHPQHPQSFTPVGAGLRPGVATLEEMGALGEQRLTRFD